MDDLVHFSECGVSLRKHNVEKQLPKCNLMPPSSKKRKYVRKSDNLNCCGVSFTGFMKQKHYDWHMTAMHNGDKPLKCPECGMWELNLPIHMSQNHNIDKYLGNKCAECDKAFMSPQKLKIHVSEKHNVNKYHCGQCDKGFPFKKHYQIHQSVIHNINPQPCNKSNYKETEGPYLCNQCDIEFTKNTYFESHVRTHTGERPYQCTQCDLAFTQHHLLSGHTKEHTKGDSGHCKAKKPKISKLRNNNNFIKRKVVSEGEKRVNGRDISDCHSKPNVKVKKGRMGNGWSVTDIVSEPMIIKEEQIDSHIGKIEDINESKNMIKYDMRLYVSKGRGTILKN